MGQALQYYMVNEFPTGPESEANEEGSSQSKEVSSQSEGGLSIPSIPLALTSDMERHFKKIFQAEKSGKLVVMPREAELYEKWKREKGLLKIST